MADFDVLSVLEKLPERARGRDAGAADATPSPRSWTNTLTERYVRESILRVSPVTEFSLEPLMAALAAGGARPPVSADDIEAAFTRMHRDDAARAKQLPSYMPRLLRTLNGPDFELVDDDVLHAAVRREQAVAGMRHGWGVVEPPARGVAYRTLVSCGLDARLFPAYATLPPTVRGRFMHAWAGTCRRFGWEPVVQHPKDVKAEQRYRAMLTAAATAGEARQQQQKQQQRP